MLTLLILTIMVEIEKFWSAKSRYSNYSKIRKFVDLGDTKKLEEILKLYKAGSAHTIFLSMLILLVEDENVIENALLEGREDLINMYGFHSYIKIFLVKNPAHNLPKSIDISMKNGYFLKFDGRRVYAPCTENPQIQDKYLAMMKKNPLYKKGPIQYLLNSKHEKIRDICISISLIECVPELEDIRYIIEKVIKNSYCYNYNGGEPDSDEEYAEQFDQEPKAKLEKRFSRIFANEDLVRYAFAFGNLEVLKEWFNRKNIPTDKQFNYIIEKIPTNYGTSRYKNEVFSIMSTFGYHIGMEQFYKILENFDKYDEQFNYEDYGLKLDDKCGEIMNRRGVYLDSYESENKEQFKLFSTGSPTKVMKYLAKLKVDNGKINKMALIELCKRRQPESVKYIFENFDIDFMLDVNLLSYLRDRNSAENTIDILKTIAIETSKRLIKKINLTKQSNQNHEVSIEESNCGNIFEEQDVAVNEDKIEIVPKGTKRKTTSNKRAKSKLKEKLKN